MRAQILVKDSNVVCVADAAGCLGALAQGLRREFAPTARALFPVLLDKLKDKNANVCAQSGQALAAFHRRGPPCAICRHTVKGLPRCVS